VQSFFSSSSAGSQPPPGKSGSGGDGTHGPRTDAAADAERDTALIHRYRSGDATALAELLEAYQRRIFGVCLRMLHRPDDAPDLAQESMVKVIEGIDSFDGRSALSTWIIRVTMNCCLSHLRREKLRRTTPLEFEAPRPAAGAERMLPTPELRADRRVLHEESVRLMEQALRSLEPDARAMLVLRDLQDLDYEQISRVLGVPLGTVKSRLFRARLALREAMSRLDQVPTDEADHTPGNID
jgi:RNA polymerase sigma-70 factor, ECF subfamily